MLSSKLASVWMMFLVALMLNGGAQVAEGKLHDGKDKGKLHDGTVKSHAQKSSDIHHHYHSEEPEEKNNEEKAEPEEGQEQSEEPEEEKKVEPEEAPEQSEEPEEEKKEEKVEPEEPVEKSVSEEPAEPEEPKEKKEEKVHSDCDVGKWSAWTVCSVSCGDVPGVQTRSRHVEPKSCDMPKMEARNCTMIPCPVDCVIGDWTAWGNCSAKCRKDGAVLTRTREVTTQPAHGGKECCGELKETKPCGEAPTHCKKSPWTPWSECSATCNTGSQSRTRGIETPASCGGAPCICDYKETMNCHHKECPTACEVSSWSEWTECPKTCGGAFQTRKRSITQIPYGGGADCPELMEARNCASDPCDKPCVVSDWSPWSECSKTCYGLQLRTRFVKVPSEANGKPCDALHETKSCNHDCVLDCKLGEWGPWSACSKTCGKGAKSRSREVLQYVANGGAACGDLSETDCCSNMTCPEADF